MKYLTLDEALKLYKILSIHLPEIDEQDTILQFVGKIIHSTIEKERQEDYLEAVSILTGLSIEDIIANEPKDVLEMFTQGLMDNHIIDLVVFVKRFLQCQMT